MFHKTHLMFSLGRMDEQAATEVYAYKSFKNTELGFMSLILWVKKNTAECLPPLFIMEATGVYHEKLAYFLSGKGHAVSIVMPNKTSNFFKTLEGKNGYRQGNVCRYRHVRP